MWPFAVVGKPDGIQTVDTVQIGQGHLAGGWRALTTSRGGLVGNYPTVIPQHVTCGAGQPGGYAESAASG